MESCKFKKTNKEKKPDLKGKYIVCMYVCTYIAKYAINLQSMYKERKKKHAYSYGVPRYIQREEGMHMNMNLVSARLLTKYLVYKYF